MPLDELMKIRVGNGLLAGAFVVGMAAAFIGVDVAMFVGAATSAVPGFFQIWFLVIGVLCLAGLVGLAVALVRNPRLIGRTILVTRDAVVMPARRFGVIPLGDVAGVGLVRMRNPRNGAPAGSWAVAVWRCEGSIAYAGGFQFGAALADPARSKAAQAAAQLHDAVAHLQGPNGPLLREEMQSRASFGPYEPFTGTWDPVRRSAAL